MSMTQYSLRIPHLQETAERPIISGLFGQILQAFARMAAFYRTRHALMQLDDHALSDIGLHRSQIDGVARALSRDI